MTENANVIEEGIVNSQLKCHHLITLTRNIHSSMTSLGVINANYVYVRAMDASQRPDTTKVRTESTYAT